MIPYFDYPWLLVAAPLLAGAVFALVHVTFRRRRARLERIGTQSMVSRLMPAAAERVPRRRALLLAAAALCAGVAFAGPRWGSEQAVVQGSGVDVALALDASLSMLATDVRPTRLAKMKEEARRLLAMSDGNRYGLIAFAGRSYILTPLTVDQGALSLFLDNLNPSVVGQAGSSLSRAIRQGTDLLLSTETTSDRALVIMSDGEAFEPEAEVVAAAKRAADNGIAVITVGFGTRAGSTIPLRTTAGSSLKRDENGQVVVTHYTPSLLQAAATAANGTFIDASMTDKASRIRKAMSTLRTGTRRGAAGRDRHPRFQLFLIPALLLVLFDTLFAERRGRRGRAASAATIAALLLGALALPRPARADDGGQGDKLFRAGKYSEAAAAYQQAIKDGNASPRLLYNLGTALIAAGRPSDAVAPLQQAAESRELDLRYRALFNLGLVYLNRARAAKDSTAQQAYSAAADAYKRALRVQPEALDAKWNYELANREKKKGGGGGGGGGQAPPQPSGQPPMPQPEGSLGQREAAEVLNSAAREEREVQARQQRENQPSRPPGGKDW